MRRIPRCLALGFWAATMATLTAIVLQTINMKPAVPQLWKTHAHLSTTAADHSELNSLPLPANLKAPPQEAPLMTMRTEVVSDTLSRVSQPSHRDPPSSPKSAHWTSRELLLLDAFGAPIPQSDFAIYDHNRRHRKGLWSGKTNEHGLALGESHSQLALETLLRKTPGLVVTLKTPIRDLGYGAYPVPILQFQQPRFVFQAPPTGSFQVRVTDPEQVPARHAHLRLMATHATEDRPVQLISTSITNADGIATFDYIGAGLKVHIEASYRDHRFMPLETPPWIVHPGRERRPIAVQFTHSPVTMSGRVLGITGFPLRGAWIQILRSTNGVPTDWGGRCGGSYPFVGDLSGIATTDGDGYFELSFDEPIEAGAHELTAVLRGRTHHSATVSVPLFHTWTGDDIPIGDLIMKPVKDTSGPTGIPKPGR